MAAGALTDPFGNPMLPFSATYNPDIVTAALPTPTAVNPPGSLVYETVYPHKAIISPATDTTNFTVAVNAGQTLAVVIHPVDGPLQPTVELFGPGGSFLGSAVAAAAGSDALLQATPAATAGTYTVTVGGAAGTTGGYTVQVFVNTAVQAAVHGGPGDGALATAQLLGPSFVPLGDGADRGALEGTFSGGSHFTSFHLDAGQAVSAGLTLLGQPQPLYSSPTFYNTGGFFLPNSVVAGDLRGNGITDLVVVDLAGVSVLYGNGDGTFQAPVSIEQGITAFDVTLADLRGTGKLDIILSENFHPGFSNGGVEVLLNDGTGMHFGSTFYATTSLPFGVAVGDLRGNGKKDIVATDGSAHVTVLYGNGDGTFGNAASFAAGSGPEAVALADLRGTGKDDIVVVNNAFDSTNALTVLLNNGTGTSFTAIGSSLGGNLRQSGTLAVGDLAGNGKPDVVLALSSSGNFAGGVAVLPGQGDGTFGAPIIYPTGSGTPRNLGALAVALGDLTGNGRLDIVTLNPGQTSGTISVLMNDGHGGFAPHQDFDAGAAGFAQLFGLALGDFRGSGLLDVATANPFKSSVSVLLNQTDRINVQIEDANGNVLAEGRPGATNLDAVINNLVAPTSGTYYAVVTGFSHRDFQLVLTRGADFTTEPNNDLPTAQPLVASRQRLATALGSVGPGDPVDTYEILAEEGQTLTIQTATPLPGPNPFAPPLDPMIKVFDAQGNLLASDDNSAPDGVNALLTLQAHDDGPLFIQVLPSAATATPTAGGYILHVSGASDELAPFQVTSTAPGPFLVALPPTMSVTFNHNLLLPTLAAADFRVDGLPATAFSVKDGSTVVFTLPAGLPNQLTHVLTVDGPIQDASGKRLERYRARFFVNNVPPDVIASSIQEGDVVNGKDDGTLTYTVQFSEALQPQTVTASAITLHGSLLNKDYAPASVKYDQKTSTLKVTFTGLSDDHYRLQIADSLTDLFGLNLDGETTVGGQSSWPIGPGQGHSGDGIQRGNFVVDFTADFPGAVDYPTPLIPVVPVGGMIYEGTPLVSTLISAGDTDRFKLSVNAGQTLTVLIHPLSAGLQPTILVGHSSATAPAAGADAVLETVPVNSDRTVTITVSGAGGTFGDYSVQVFLNTALQAAAFGGSSDGTPATAHTRAR
jgi:hypothetical protein